MKTARIKINQSLDAITLDCDQNSNGHWSMIYQWKLAGKNGAQKNDVLKDAKAALFDETWSLSEMGYKVEVIPYIN